MKKRDARFIIDVVRRVTIGDPSHYAVVLKRWCLACGHYECRPGMTIAERKTLESAQAIAKQWATTHNFNLAYGAIFHKCEDVADE